MIMSKSSISILVKGLTEKSGISQNDAENFIKAMFDVANMGLQDSKLLKMKWLGTFKVTSIKERESVDVNTGDRILIEGREKITFTPDNILKEIVNKPFAQFETVVVNEGVDFSAVDEKFSKLEEQNDATILESPEPKEEVTPSNEVIDFLAEDIAKEEEATVEASEKQPLIEQTTPKEDSYCKEPLAEEHLQQEKMVEEIPTSDTAKSTEQQDVMPVEPSVEEVSIDKHHIVLPKYLVVAVSIALLVLVGGMCWFAFNYGKLAAQRDHLALQLTNIQKKSTLQSKIQHKSQQPLIDREQESLRQKAIADSMRLVKAHEAVKMAEKVELAEKAEREISKQPVEEKKQTNTQYDADPRIRTGAYAITGVAQTIIVKEGETLSSLSKRYLGPGMECYLEAINEAKQVKAGQKVKIPKLMLKKKLK